MISSGDCSAELSAGLAAVLEQALFGDVLVVEAPVNVLAVCVADDGTVGGAQPSQVLVI